MKAEMHGETWRPWSGTLDGQRLRFGPIVRAGLRIALRKKLPLVLLFLPPVVATIIFSFVVYTVAALAQGMVPAGLGAAGGAMGQALGGGQNSLAGDFVQQLVRVRERIVGFHLSTDLFSLLLMAWFGAGLLAEDRRSGAHLLYFARPLTRTDYLLGKFSIVALFGVLGSMLPGLVLLATRRLGHLEDAAVWRCLDHRRVLDCVGRLQPRFAPQLRSSRSVRLLHVQRRHLSVARAFAQRSRLAGVVAGAMRHPHRRSTL